MTTKPNNKNDKHPIEQEWVLKLVDASENAVKGYEKYLLDEIDYSELARIMTELRDLLPLGCRNKSKKDKEKD